MNGQEAIKQTEKHPDLILLDITMPDMDGLKVCTQIRKYVTCPIQFLTAKVFRMAWRNMCRDRKRTVIVFLSLFMGIVTFMTITTLISSLDVDNYIASYVKNDFILKNNTLTSGKDEKQKFDTPFIEKLKEIDGIKNLRTTTVEQMNIKYEAKAFSKHIEWFREKYNTKTDYAEKMIQNCFWGYIIGIDSRYIEEFNKNSEHPVAMELTACSDCSRIRWIMLYLPFLTYRY